MSEILEVQGLCKHYPGFALEDVSFALRAGHITGFIGRNGAGKSTTLGCLLGLVHPDAGEARFFGLPFRGNEAAVKQRIGFVASGVNYYPNKRLSRITAITRSFYAGWDDAAYRRYMELFALDERKTPQQLSAGMKVKYALALALSHGAELLLLDEPTSGLDPVSREELLEVFLALCDEGKTVLFSTHITSDLDKCADDILYLRGGRLIAAAPTEEFASRYRLVRYDPAALGEGERAKLIGARRCRGGETALLPAAEAAVFPLQSESADLEAVMVHLEQEEA